MTLEAKLASVVQAIGNDIKSLQQTPVGVTDISIGALISSSGDKATPIDADNIALENSTDTVLKRLSWANVKATLKAYFDPLYAALSTVQTWTKAQRGGVIPLAVASNLVAVDLSLANNFSLLLQATTGQTLSNPTNAVAGQSGQITITQNAVPSALAYASNWKPIDGVAPTVSTTASAQNLLSYYVADGANIWFSLSKKGVA